VKFRKKIIFSCLSFILILGVMLPEECSPITVAQEEELAKEFINVVLQHYKFVKDPLIMGYVNKIGKKILSVVPTQAFPYHFYVVQEDVYNAFAGPAGHIFLNSGLFEAMESENELAGILAHEIAHVVSRHISQKIERSKKILIATLAGIVAGIFLGSSGSSEAATAVTMGSVAANQSITLAYSREDEMQADQIGLEYLKKAKYGGKGLLAMLKKIRNKQWFGSDQIPTYLMTHPASEDRVAYVATWVASQPKVESRTNPTDFQKAHIRLVALYSDKDSAVTKFETAVKNDPENPMGHYGYGLTLSRAGNHKGAIVHLKKTLEKNPFNPDVLIDLGRIYFLNGQYTKALTTLQSTMGAEHNNPIGDFFYGRTLLTLGRLKDAEMVFAALIQKETANNRAFFFLSEVYSRQGKPSEAHYYLGIYFKKTGNLKNATFHLNRAREKTDDPEKKLKIKKMLKEIEAIDTKKS
tara:strand:- start:138 stop:1541 length:1404 start_codon:yes stop_codon:yes gene_type:complete